MARIIDVSALAQRVGIDENRLLDKVGIDDLADRPDYLVDRLRQEIEQEAPERFKTFLSLASHFLK